MWLQQPLQVLEGDTNIGSLLPLASLGTLNSAENCLFLLLLQLYNFNPASLLRPTSGSLPSSFTDNVLRDHGRKCLPRFDTALFFQNNLLMLMMIEQPSIRANEPVVNKILLGLGPNEKKAKQKKIQPHLKVSGRSKITFQVGILESIISQTLWIVGANTRHAETRSGCQTKRERERENF